MVRLYTDMPTRRQISRLLDHRREASVSVYLSTDPASDGQAERIELGNLAGEAGRQLVQADTAKADVRNVEELLSELTDDHDFWRYQARSLAVFVTPDGLSTFRLPHRLQSLVEVSDRFHVKPLLRAVTFPQVALVLALAQGSVRVLEVAPDVPPNPLSLPGLPTDIASAAGKASIGDRAPSGRLQGGEGQKVRMRQYARRIDQALRPLLGALGVPLILAATEPLDSIYRSVSTYPGLAAATITGNPETRPDLELTTAARDVIDQLNAASLRTAQELYAAREAESRAAADLVVVARAATRGAIDTLLVDIDAAVPGTIDEQTGAVELTPESNAVSYGVLDEVARRVWNTGGTVLAVRQDDIPNHAPAAAILRYAI